MKWRTLRAGELDHELLWLVVSLAALAGAVVWLQLGLPRPACVFHHLTGWACPGCGTTRCLQHLLAGSFGEAWQLNPLAFLSFVGVGLFDLYAVAVLALRLPRLRFEKVSAGSARLFRVTIFIALGLNWIWLLASGV